MKNYKKFETDDITYKQILDTQIDNGKIISERVIGARKKLYYKNKMIATSIGNSSLFLGSLPVKYFYAFLARFNKHLYSKFANNEDLWNQNIDFKGFSKAKNKDYWQSIPVGSYFYNIDLKSAYWQVAHKLGYISTDFYEEFIENKEYKQAKRYCISFLSRKNFTNYYSADTMHNSISCDNSILKKVYDNIRKQLYVYISDTINVCEDYLWYNIDGVAVIADNVPVVKNKFKELGLLFKVYECKKINENQYLESGIVKNFKNKI